MTAKAVPVKPTTPFKPRQFGVIGPTRRTTTTRPRGAIYGPSGEITGWKQPGKERACWDLEIRCDGYRWADRLYAAARAQTLKEELEAGYRQGWSFDPRTKRFVYPDVAPSEGPTVLSETVAWWRAHWATIEPKSRQETLRYISRPIRELVRQDLEAPPGLEDYLMWQMLPPKAAGVAVPAEHTAAFSWLAGASLPVQDADVTVWQAYVDRWRVNSRTGRPIAQSSLNRHLADVRQMWGWVCAVHQLPNPWQMIKTGARSSVGGRKAAAVKPVDRTIVLSPAHVRELARLCGDMSFGPLAEVYVLLLGIAGGRPGESAGVHATEVKLPEVGVGEVRFSRTTRRDIARDFLDNDDDADWGPLKGREIEEARVAPLPSCDARRINELIDQAEVRGHLFPGWDWEKFRLDVWTPAKAEMAARQVRRAQDGKVTREEVDALVSALERLRLHDLRHAACSMWLNTPGMEVRVACEWSGHKRLSVFLDIYQGLMPGSKASAMEKLDAAWGVA